MKKFHIIGIVLILGAIAALFMASEDIATYSTFAQAAKVDGKIKVAGQLVMDKDMYYEPEKDPNYFTFHIKDMEGTEKKVVLYGSKPQDFEMSEQIVLTGKMDGDEFVATDMLTKCPSKYKEDEIFIKESKI